MGKVWVADIGRSSLVLRWTDPVTGEQRQRSAGTSNRKQAERLAGKVEAELDEGRYVARTRWTWREFRERYETEKLRALSARTGDAAATAMNHLERIAKPRQASDVKTETISRLQAEMRREGLREASIACYLSHLRAVCRWGKRMGIIQQLPEFEMPRRPKGKAMRGRPITAEEFERMLAVTGQVRPDDAEKWKWYLRGLWLSGLRLEESLQLSWEPEAPISVDLEGGRRPRLRIAAEAEKGRQNRLLPITPDFAEFLAAVPMADRFGKVFKVTGLGTGWQMTGRRAGRVISAIGKRAGVVVDKQKEKFASAHDLRRSFGTRWAKKLKPAVLMVLMRHENIDTTMAYYVDFDSDEIADELWAGYDGPGKHEKQGNSPNERLPVSQFETR